MIESLQIWATFIALLTALIAIIVIAYAWQISRRLDQSSRFRISLAGIIIIWYGLAVWLSNRGFFATPAQWSAGDITGFILFGTLMTLPVVLFLVAMRLSPSLRQLAAAVSLPAITAFQVYRVMGIVFLWMALAGLLPRSLGITTGIWDAAIGLTALPVAWSLARQTAWSRPLAIGWNIAGILDFVVAISIISLDFLGVINLTPNPVRIGFAPLALISLFNVPLSICLHLIGLWRLRMDQ